MKKKFAMMDALLRVSVFFALGSGIAVCGVAHAAKLPYSPKVSQYDDSLKSSFERECEAASFKDVERDASRWGNPKNTPAWAQDTPEAAAEKKRLEKLIEDERKNREEAALQKRLQRNKENWHRNSFSGIRERKEKEYLEGLTSPDAARSFELNSLKKKAEELAKSIDWQEVERIYNKLTQLIESARMARGISGKEGDLSKIQREFIAEWLDTAKRLTVHQGKYIEFAKSLKDEKKRALFDSYFDEEASKVVPRTFTHTSGRLVDECSKALKEIGAVVPRDLAISRRYRMFLDSD